MIDLRKRESKSNINEGEWPKGVSGIIGNIRDLANRYIRSHKNATTSEVVDHIFDTIEKLPDGNMKNVSKDTIEKLVKDYNLDENTEKETDMIDLREKKTSKHEDDMEIKFVNKGDEFKSEKADDVKIVDIEKKDDKTEVTYKLGDEEKKNDIEDVLKMLNGAEYKKVDDKKDEKKACEDDTEEKPEEEPVEEKKSCEEDGDKTDSEKTPDEEKPAEEKKEAEDEKDPEDDEIEMTLAEDFHVPGTDIILEKGDVIRIIPRKDN